MLSQVANLDKFKKQKQEAVCLTTGITCPEKIKLDAYKSALIDIAIILSSLHGKSLSYFFPLSLSFSLCGLADW